MDVVACARWDRSLLPSPKHSILFLRKSKRLLNRLSGVLYHRNVILVVTMRFSRIILFFRKCRFLQHLRDTGSFCLLSTLMSTLLYSRPVTVSWSNALRGGHCESCGAIGTSGGVFILLSRSLDHSQCVPNENPWRLVLRIARNQVRRIFDACHGACLDSSRADLCSLSWCTVSLPNDVAYYEGVKRDDVVLRAVLSSRG